MDNPVGLEVDHINRDTLDNRMANLRPCTRRENSLNRGMHKNNTSGHKGVAWHKTNKKWQASFCGKHLGYFDTLAEALACRGAYDV